MKTTTRNRLLSLTVTLCLVFGSLPAAAFASEEEVGPFRQPEQEEIGTLPDVERAEIGASLDAERTEPDIVAPSSVADEALPVADAAPSASPIASPSSASSRSDADKAAGGALGLLKTAIMLSGKGLAFAEGKVREMNDNPNPGILEKLFMPTKYWSLTILNELASVETTLHQMDYELDAINNKLDDLKHMIEQDEAQDRFDVALKDVQTVTDRIEPLISGKWGSLKAIRAFYEDPDRQTRYGYTINEDGSINFNGDEESNLTDTDAAALKVLTDEFLNHLIRVYGSGQINPGISFEGDMLALSKGLYSVSELRTPTLVEAQMELSSVDAVYEHAMIEDADYIFMYVSRYMYELAFLDSLYANFVDDYYPEWLQDNPGASPANYPYKAEYDPKDWSDAKGPLASKADEAVSLQNLANYYLNEASEKCGILDLLPLYDFGIMRDDQGNAILDPDGNPVPALTQSGKDGPKDLLTENLELHGYFYEGSATRPTIATSINVMRLRTYANHQEVLMPTKAMYGWQFSNIGDFIRDTDSPSDPASSIANTTNAPFYNSTLMSKDGRFMIPTSEASLYGLWPGTQHDPVQFYHNLDVPVPGGVVAIPINDVSLNGKSQYDYRLLDARYAASGDAASVPTVTDLCNYGTVAPGTFPGTPACSGYANEVALLPLFVDVRTGMNGDRVTPTDDHGSAGTFVPKDPNLGIVSLTDGDTLDFTGLLGGVYDFKKSVIYVSGNVNVVGNPDEMYRNLQFELLDGAHLTVQGLDINQDYDGGAGAAIQALGNNASLILADDLTVTGRRFGVAMASSITDQGQLVMHPTLSVDLQGHTLWAVGWGCPVFAGIAYPLDSTPDAELSISGGTFKGNFNSSGENLPRDAIGNVTFADCILDFARGIPDASRIKENCESIGASEYHIVIGNASYKKAGLAFRDDLELSIVIFDQDDHPSYTTMRGKTDDPWQVGLLTEDIDELTYSYWNTMFTAGFPEICRVEVTCNHPDSWMPTTFEFSNLYTTKEDLKTKPSFVNSTFYDDGWDVIRFDQHDSMYVLNIDSPRSDMVGIRNTEELKGTLRATLLGDGSVPSVSYDISDFLYFGQNTSAIVVLPGDRMPLSAMQGFSFKFDGDSKSCNWFLGNLTASWKSSGSKKGSSYGVVWDQGPTEDVRTWVSGDAYARVYRDGKDDEAPLYEYEVKTADKHNGDAEHTNILFDLCGDKGMFIPPMNVGPGNVWSYARGGDSSAFENGVVDRFRVSYEKNVGQIDEMTVDLNGDDWYPEYITVSNANGRDGTKPVTFDIGFMLEKKHTYYFDVTRTETEACFDQNGFLDAQKVIDLLAGSKQEYVSFDVKRTDVLDKSVLAYLKESGKNIILNMKLDDGDARANGSQSMLRWIFKGVDITDTTRDVRLGFSLLTPTEAGVSHLAADGSAACVRFSHEGPLPGMIEVHANLERFGSFAPQQKFFLYHYDESSDALESCNQDAVLDNDRTVPFSIDHASTYVLSTKDRNDQGNGLSPMPKSGDTVNAPAWACLLLASSVALGAAMRALARKRKVRR